MPQDEYLRRADGTIYGVREPEKPAGESWETAWAKLDTLPYPVYDNSGCRSIDLGPDVYGLVDWDGEYRVGLYFTLPEEDEGGICAVFERFEDFKAFCARLSVAHSPNLAGPQALADARSEWPERIDAAKRQAACSDHVINPMDNNWCRTCDTGECPDCGQSTFYSERDGAYHHIDAENPGCFLIAAHGAE
jgi:hypothetical protein